MKSGTTAISDMGELEQLNRELAALLDRPPAALFLGAERCAEDPLVLCGVLGGKDVGKSTLVNALAKATISVDEDEVGPGTRRARAYVHREYAAAAVDRLRPSELNGDVDVTVHDADAIRNVVLVDLPDFDSEFAEHLETVRRAAPRLDRILWVVTPRKVGDREWAAMFRRVVVDSQNVLVVLNKSDELLTGNAPPAEWGRASSVYEEEARRFWEGRRDWLARVVQSAGCICGESQRFLVSSAFADTAALLERVGHCWDDPDWKRFAGEKPVLATISRLVSEELDRLRATVLAPISGEKAAGIKAANARAQRAAAAATLREHYELDRLRDTVHAACDEEYQRGLITDAFDEEAVFRLAMDVRSSVRPADDLADELLQRFVEEWPVMRLTYWMFGWLSRGIGRRASGGRRTPPEKVGERFDATELRNRVELVRARFLADNAAILERFSAIEAVPSAEFLVKTTVKRIGRLPTEIETELIGAQVRRQGRPGFFGRMATWLVVFWFPLVQPCARELLRIYQDATALNVSLAAYHLVTILGGWNLLSGLGAIVAVFAIVLTSMFVRRLRRIRSMLEDVEGPAGAMNLRQRILAELCLSVIEPLAEPLRKQKRMLQRIYDRIGAVAGSRSG